MTSQSHRIQVQGGRRQGAGGRESGSKSGSTGELCGGWRSLEATARNTSKRPIVTGFGEIE